MAKLEVKDKDPFAHADDKPKDDITILGFISRAAYRYFRLIVIIYLFYPLNLSSKFFHFHANIKFMNLFQLVS